MINIGKITKTHKLDGSLKLFSSFSHLEQLIGEKVLVENEKNTVVLGLKKIKKISEKMYIIMFEEIKGIDGVKSLVGSSLKIREDLIPKLDNDDIYVDDLIGFKVYNNKNHIGDVVDILDTQAHSILVVLEGEKEILIPYVEDVFIKQIDVDNRKVEVELLEGML